MTVFPWEKKINLSSYSILKVDKDICIHSDWLTIEFLNNIKLFSLLDHRLILKKGVHVILMRNLDMSLGLCNETRLIVEELGIRLIEAINVTRANIGNKVYIPRLNLDPFDRMTPFKFHRHQFPLLVCFAMTINKSQGQTFSQVGMFLPRPAFKHG